MTELEKLEVLAKAATPGPWEAKNWAGSCGILRTDNKYRGDYNSRIAEIPHWGKTNEHGQSKSEAVANAAFIAAANPLAILTLIQELKRMRIALEGLAECDGRSTTLEHANSVIAGMGKAAHRALTPGDTP